MVARNYSVNGNAPVPVAEFALPNDLLLYNADQNNTIYLDKYRGMIYTSGAILPPLAGRIWRKGDPCFAICAPGQTAQLNVSDNAGDLFNPAAIATSILNQGLAQQIAVATNALGIPPTDAPVALYNVTQANVASGVTPNPTGVLDCTRYTNAEIWCGDTGAAVGEYTRQLKVSWFSDTAGTDSILDQNFYYCPGNSGPDIGIVGVKLAMPGGARGLKLIPSSAVTTTASSVNLRVYVSTRQQNPSTQYWNACALPAAWADTAPGNDGWWSTNTAGPIANGSYNLYPSSFAGPAMLNARVTGLIPGTIQVDAVNLKEGVPFGSFILSSGSPIGSIPLILPYSPMKILVTVAGGSVTNFAASLVMNSW